MWNRTHSISECVLANQKKQNKTKKQKPRKICSYATKSVDYFLFFLWWISRLVKWTFSVWHQATPASEWNIQYIQEEALQFILRWCLCVFIVYCVRLCVSARVLIVAREWMLSEVAGETRLQFWTRSYRKQMVHYTPVWQPNCSLYSTQKHTCAHWHACAHRTMQHRHKNAFFLVVRAECSGGDASCVKTWIFLCVSFLDHIHETIPN